MASRRKATPLFDLVGPLAPGTDTKPRYRSPAPPPAPNLSTTEDSDTDLGPDAGESEPQASTAVAQPERPPIEVHTAQTLSESETDSACDNTPDDSPQGTEKRSSDHRASADESSPIPVIENKQGSQSIPDPRPDPRPDPVSAPPPTAQPEPDQIDSLDETESFGTARGFADLKQALLTGTNRIYFASGVVIIGLVLVWLVLNALLTSGTTQDIDTSAGLQTHSEGGIIDPMGDGSVPSGDVVGGRQVPTIEMGGTGESAARTGLNAQPTPAPGLTDDPRVPGQNYLHLAGRLSRSEATRAAAFLTERGQPAIAVGMDSGTLRGNNTEKFLLISLFDVPEGRYSAMKGQRDGHVERIAALGEIWARDHGGTVNFHDPYWVKYGR